MTGTSPVFSLPMLAMFCSSSALSGVEAARDRRLVVAADVEAAVGAKRLSRSNPMRTRWYDRPAFGPSSFDSSRVVAVYVSPLKHRLACSPDKKLSMA